MAFTEVAKDMNIIAALNDEPNDVDGLSAAELKAKFDEGGLALKQYINSTLLDELEASTAAASLGAVDSGGTASTVQTELGAKYEKPNGGIPKSDLASAVQTSLGKADTALQEHQSLAAYSTTAQMNTAIAAHHDSTKQDKLPQVTNDRYLHTNSSTGALEWGTLPQSGDAKVFTLTSLSDLVTGQAIINYQISGKIPSVSYNSQIYYYAGKSFSPDLNKYYFDFSQVYTTDYYNGTYSAYKRLGISIISQSDYTVESITTTSDTTPRFLDPTAPNTTPFIPTQDGHPATKKYVDDHHDSSKQDTISDLSTIRSGAALGATAVQPESGKGLFSGNYNDLTNKPTIPVVPTNVSAFTNDAGYLTQHQSLSAYRTSAAQDVIDAGKVSTSEYNPDAKTSAMTQSVGKDSSGKLWTIPGSSGGGTVTSVSVSMNGATKGTVTTSGTIDLGTVITAHQDISGKVDKVSGKGLSTNDYTTTEKNKLSGIAAGAEVNVNADWNASSGDAQILNKPTAVSAFTNDAGYLTSHQDISGKENMTNKVTSISSASTDTQYPSAKCVYDLVGTVEATLNAIRGVS